MKGAAAAAANTVPIATGAGDTAFGFINYTNVTGKPVTTTIGGASIVAPRTRFYSVTAVAGVWSLAISGFSSVAFVVPVAITAGNTLGVVCSATLSSYNTTSATGAVIIHSASDNSLGTTQEVQVMVVGL